MNCSSVFDRFMGLVFKGLTQKCLHGPNRILRRFLEGDFHEVCKSVWPRDFHEVCKSVWPRFFVTLGIWMKVVNKIGKWG